MPYEIDFLRAGEGNGDAIVVKSGETKNGDYYLRMSWAAHLGRLKQILAGIKVGFHRF